MNWKIHNKRKQPDYIFSNTQRLYFLATYFSLIPILHSFSAIQESQFSQISIRDGLSQNSVVSIIQNQKGFLWFGTSDGLNRYDGYEFVIYKHSANDTTSLSDVFVNTIHEDQNGFLWIGGVRSGGLNKFDSRTGKSIRYFYDPYNENSISDNIITCITQDSSNHLWIATHNGITKYDPMEESFKRYFYNHGGGPDDRSGRFWWILIDQYQTIWAGSEKALYQLDPMTEEVHVFRHQPENSYSISHDDVRVILEDQDGMIWICTQRGLNCFNRKTGRFTHYLHNPRDVHSISHDEILTAYQDSGNRLWIGTRKGLNLFDKQTGGFTRYLVDEEVFSIYGDRSNMLWIGTWSSGVFQLNLNAKPFHHIKEEPGNPNSLSDSRVFSLLKDQLGDVWIGTRHDGLNHWSRRENRFTRYPHRPNDTNSLSYNAVWSLCEDQTGTIWAGTGNGLNEFNRKDKKFIHHINDPENLNSLSNNDINAIVEDHQGYLWIGTGNGLNRYDRNTRVFQRFIHESNDLSSIQNSVILCIYEDHRQKLWLGHEIGLSMYDPETEKFTSYRAERGNPNSLNHDFIYCICEDHHGVLWIGTPNGLNRLDRSRTQFSHFSSQDGLPNNAVYGILCDNHNNLWISTNLGLSKFNPETAAFKNYDASDGLQSNEFNMYAYHQGVDGEMFFGGINGFNAFYPDSIQDNTYIPPVVVTRFQLFNQDVPIGKMEDGRPLLNQLITDTKEIKLSHKDNVFSFEFAALNYNRTGKNEYGYMMEGFENEWNIVDNRRYVTYTGLPPGKYTFRVKGSNNDGIWNEVGSSIQLTITPPFWETPAFRIVSILLFIGALFAFYRIRMHAIHERNKELELRVHDRTEELEKLNNELRDFAYIVSHDLKAPLRGVSQLVTWISNDYNDIFNEEGREQIALLKGRVRRMSNLIDGVLRYSRAGRPDDSKRRINLNKFLLEIIDSLALPEHIKVEVQEDMPTVYGYPTQTQQIFQNLISNAIKYNNKKKGIVRIGFDQEGGFWRFFVSDNGPGISEKYHERIFKIFQTLEARDTRESTGVGLSVVKKIVERFGGHIWLESKEGEGCTFFFTWVKHEKDRVPEKRFEYA